VREVRVAFVCVHNSCRSQIAEALAKNLYADQLVAFSAGTEVVARLNQDAVRIMKQRFGIDMEATQVSKLVDVLENIDVLITMGCNVDCPFVPCKHREDWGLDDPTGKDDMEYERTIDLILAKLASLVARLENRTIQI